MKEEEERKQKEGEEGEIEEEEEREQKEEDGKRVEEEFSWNTEKKRTELRLLFTLASESLSGRFENKREIQRVEPKHERMKSNKNCKRKAIAPYFL